MARPFIKVASFFAYMKRQYVVIFILLLLLGVLLLHLFARTVDVVLFSFDTELIDDPVQVRQLLALLEKYNVTATFFVMGQLAEREPELIKEISLKHEIACHTHTHAKLTKLHYLEQEQEILLCKQALHYLDIIVAGFRAPYNAADNTTYAVLRAHDFHYDASQLQYVPLYPPNPKIPLIKVSTFIVPLSDAVMIYAPFPTVFFSLAKAKRGTVSLLFHPHRAMQFEAKLEELILFYKKQQAQFLTHQDYLEMRTESSYSKLHQ